MSKKIRTKTEEAKPRSGRSQREPGNQETEWPLTLPSDAERRPVDMRNIASRTGKYPEYIAKITRFGKLYSMNFTHAQHGGPEGALICAMAWRDMMLDAFDPRHHEEWKRSQYLEGVARRPKRKPQEASGPTSRPMSMRNIHRRDALGDDPSEGWQVVLARGNQKRTRYFADATHGGRKGALAAAQAWRDETIRSLWTTGYPAWVRTVLRSNNSSGVTGVTRATRRRKKADGTYSSSPAWCAQWMDLDGKAHIRAFRIATHGDKGAFELAVQAREAAVRALAEEAKHRGGRSFLAGTMSDRAESPSAPRRKQQRK